MKALLVEDSPADAALIREMLTGVRNASFELEHVNRLGAGLERLEAAEFDVVLLDLMLPDSRGLETFTRLQAHAPRVPVLIMSGLDDEEVAVEAVRAGAQDYLVKGQVDPSLLVRAIRYGVERKRTEQALKESNERFRTLFENATDGILVSDEQTKSFVMCNGTMCRMLGYSPEEMKNLVLADIHPEEDLHSAARRLEKPPGKKTSMLVDIPVRRKDGNVFYADIVLSSITLDGKTYSMGVFRDATDRIQAEDLQRELEAEKMVVEKLKRLDRIKNDFVETVTHELRTPMTPLRSSIEMFLDGTLGEITPRQREFLEMIARNVERLSRYATDMLSLSRLESGKHTLHPSHVTLLPIIRPVVELLRRNARKKNSSISLNVNSEMTAFADPDAVSEVLTNLLNNALAHTPQGTRVIVSSKLPREHCVEISVADSGPGIPKHAISKVFDKFYQAGRDSGPGYKGTGVGLAVCKALVEAMGGQISVKSRPGKGAVFAFTLPTTRLT